MVHAIETPTSRAFSRAAEDYDDVVIANPIIRRLRVRAQARMLHRWHQGDHILELNCGTGPDAVFLGRHSIHVLATDLSERMVQRTREHILAEHLESMVESRVLAFSGLSALSEMGFDGALSMFGGLNCAENLEAVAANLAGAMKPEAMFIASFIGKYSIWEIVSSLLRGNLHKAFRRWSKKHVDANVEGVPVPTRYWSVPELRAIFSPWFIVERIESWSVLSPLPSSLRVYRRFPRLCDALFRLEEKMAHWYPFNRLGDHVMLEMRRRP